MATEEAVNQAAGVADDSDVVSLALADLGMTKPEEAEDEPKSEETISDNDETKDPEEKSEESGEDAEPEAEEQEESDKDEEEDADEKDSDEEAPKDKVQRRIDKLVAKQREAEEKATAVSAELEQLKAAKAELEAQLNQTTRPVLSPTADNPLADVRTTEELEQRVQNAHAVRDWAMKNADGATIKKPDGSEQFISSEEVRDYLVKADRIVMVDAPARRQWLERNTVAVNAANEVFPDLLKAGTDLNKAYQATVKIAPQLLEIPEHEYWVGLALYGEQALMAAQKAKEAKAAAEKKVSSKKSESKPPTPAKPVSTAKSSSRGGKPAASLSGANIDDLQSWVADSLLG